MDWSHGSTAVDHQWAISLIADLPKSQDRQMPDELRGGRTSEAALARPTGLSSLVETQQRVPLQSASANANR